eukprot:m.56341 g.56341  ORF g.56341 m.56341 type:complete len:53 (+) comp11187_c0_seq4:1085-1243(+)
MNVLKKMRIFSFVCVCCVVCVIVIDRYAYIGRWVPEEGGQNKMHQMPPQYGL